MWELFSPDANQLDYTFWQHNKAKTCNGHPNITALRTSVEREWMVMSRGYFIKSSEAFRRRLEGIIASGGGSIG